MESFASNMSIESLNLEAKFPKEQSKAFPQQDSSRTPILTNIDLQEDTSRIARPPSCSQKSPRKKNILFDTQVNIRPRYSVKEESDKRGGRVNVKVSLKKKVIQTLPKKIENIGIGS